MDGLDSSVNSIERIRLEEYVHGSRRLWKCAFVSRLDNIYILNETILFSGLTHSSQDLKDPSKVWLLH